MANIYKSKFTGDQIDNSVELTMSNTATNGQVLTANGSGGASWEDATEVVANPVLAGTESNLTGLEIDGTKYKVPTGGGTEVVANPTGEATEELTKLQVGSGIYSIPNGGSGGVYAHIFTLESSEYIVIFTMYFSTSESTFTNLIRDFILDNEINVSGYVNSKSEGYFAPIVAIRGYPDQRRLAIDTIRNESSYRIDYYENTTTFTYSETVIPL